jgi:Ca2+-binding EF-hand superfamily protein
VDLDDLVGTYDASKHPDVIRGTKTKAAVLTEFLHVFDGDGDGIVTAEEFQAYYGHVGSSIDDDDYFELMIRNAWHISGGEGWCANTTCRRVLVTHRDGTQTVEEIEDDLHMDATDTEAMKANLAKRGIDAVSVSLSGSVDAPSGGSAPAAGAPSTPARGKSSGGGSSSWGGPGSVDRPSTAPASGRKVRVSKTKASPLPTPVLSEKSEPIVVAVPPALEQLRGVLAARGARGIIGLGRSFRVVDDDGSGTLSLKEFRRAMTEFGLSLSSSEVTTLFRYFDFDRSGDVSFEEFLGGVKVRY